MHELGEDIWPGASICVLYVASRGVGQRVPPDLPPSFATSSGDCQLTMFARIFLDRGGRFAVCGWSS